MPLKKIALKAGVNRENTRLSSEGVWYESNLIRFRQGTPEKIGGWVRTSANTFLGVCRSLWNWATLAGNNLLALGTSVKFYIENGGTYYDITPNRATVTLTNPFTTVNLSSVVTVTDANGGYKNNDFVTFYGSSAVGGLTILGQYQITYTTGNSYTITAASPATSGATGGGTVIAVYQVNTGGGTVAALVGWGSGGWGLSSWDADGAAATNNLATIAKWNQSNWGQDLLFNQQGGPLFYWSAYIGFISSTLSITIASPGVVVSPLTTLILGQSIVLTTTGALPTGLLPGVTYYIVNLVVTGVSTFNLSTTPPATATTLVNTSGTQSGVHSISPVGVALASSNGATQAPISCNLFLVSDINRFVICFGTNDVFSTVFDPLLVRWSDQGSLIQWNPQITNQAGSVRLTRGSKIVAALQSRQEILVWTDQAFYNMQYIGPPYVWGNQLLANNVSIAGSGCAAIAANVAYWMGNNKFYAYDGRVNTLPCNVREYVFSNMNIAQAGQFFAGTIEQFSEVWWFYCSTSSTTIDSYVVYNYLEQCWYYGSLARTAWIDSTLRGYPMGATYLGNVCYHENGVDDVSTGSPVAMNSYVTSAEFEIGDGDRFAFIRRILPDFTFRNSTAANPAVTMTLNPLKNSGSGYDTPASVALTASAAVTGSGYPQSTPPSITIDQYTGQVFVRVRGRQMSLTISCNTAGTQWQAGVQRMDVRPDGRRA